MWPQYPRIDAKQHTENLIKQGMFAFLIYVIILR